MVDARWFEQWCDCTGFNSNTGKAVEADAKGSRPGPIDNSRLADTKEGSVAGRAALKLGINEREDYVLVHEKVWHLLMNW